MSERQALGIDINENARTGGINYDLVNEFIQQGEYDFLIIKAGLGFTKSETFDEQRQNVERLNIPYVTYHLIDPRVDMQAQARKYVDWVGTEQPNYILDVERPAAGVDIPSKAQLLNNINTLAGLTGKQPILYSRMGIVNQMGLDGEAKSFRWWMADYLNKATPYQCFEDFVKDFAGRLPPTVANTELQDNVVLWQFSPKGDGRHYIYNAQTQHPKFKNGLKSADLNISIMGRSEFMQLMFGRVPDIQGASDNQTTSVDTHESGPVGPSGPTGATYPGMTNQDMINLIFKAAQPFTAHPWEDWAIPAGLESLAVPSENRSKPYTGPRVEDLPNLTGAEKSAILAAMGSQQSVNPGESPSPDTAKSIFTPSGKAIARFASKLNKAGKPIWSIFPSDDAPVNQRIFFNSPLEVEAEPVTGDGGAQCYKLVSSPSATPLYVRLQDGTITKSS